MNPSIVPAENKKPSPQQAMANTLSKTLVMKNLDYFSSNYGSQIGASVFLYW